MACKIFTRSEGLNKCFKNWFWDEILYLSVTIYYDGINIGSLTKNAIKKVHELKMYVSK